MSLLMFFFFKQLDFSFRCRKAGGKLVKSKELFRIEAGAVRIEPYQANKDKWQQKEEEQEQEEETIHKLTTFNLGRASVPRRRKEPRHFSVAAAAAA
jgi:hypothetical protein